MAQWLRGASSCVEDYDAALAYYTSVFGPPAYLEEDRIRGWQLGDTWFTLFGAKAGGPQNSDISLHLESPAEVGRLHEAMVAAGGAGDPPTDELMYAPVRFCAVTDPFGTTWVLCSPQS